MSFNANSIREIHVRRLASLRRRGVRQVFLIVCDSPGEECRRVAKTIWPIDDVPEFPTAECGWSPATPDGPWDGCEYMPYFCALLARIR